MVSIYKMDKVQALYSSFLFCFFKNQLEKKLPNYILNLQNILTDTIIFSFTETQGPPQKTATFACVRPGLLGVFSFKNRSWEGGIAQMTTKQYKLGESLWHTVM
jgi:hypothetical protein